jgi:hypothetical protein
MTTWFRLTLVCCVMLGLFLGLTQAVDWNYQPVVSSGSLFDRATKATSDSPTSSVVGRLAFDLARAGPFGSLVLDCGLTAGNIGPPGQENHGPPEPMRPWQVAGQAATQTNAIEQPCPRNYWFSAEKLKSRALHQPLAKYSSSELR